MKQLAIMAAAVVFFILAFISWCSGLGMLTCAIRALTGSAIAYVTVALAGRMVLAILVDAAVRNTPKRQAGKAERES